jgi:hypothetical protein
MMLLLGAGSAKASAYDDTSVAGLFPVSNQGREVWNFNPNWRFHLGDVPEIRPPVMLGVWNWVPWSGLWG